MDCRGKPHAIIADTVKGKGLKGMENNPEWHAKPMSADELAGFLEELEAAR